MSITPLAISRMIHYGGSTLPSSSSAFAIASEEPEKTWRRRLGEDLENNCSAQINVIAEDIVR